MSAMAVVQLPERRAFPSDVKASGLSRNARQAWGVLCNYIERKPHYTGRAWPKMATIARDMSVSQRTAQRAINELREKHWICLPDGDAGGRGKAVVYHLHPDGQPCQKSGVTLKQREGSTDLKRVSNCHPFSDSERVTKTTVKGDKIVQKGDKNDGAYKEYLSLENSYKENSSSSSRKKPRRINNDDGDVSLSNSSEKLTPEDHEVFGRIEKSISSLLHQVNLDGLAKSLIRSAVHRQEYTLKHLAVFIEAHKHDFQNCKITNPKGLLITYAQQLRQRAEGFAFPQCFDCLDEGIVDLEDSPFNKKGPCTCESGQSKLQTDFPHWEDYQAAKAAGGPICTGCYNTGFYIHFSSKRPCHCEFGNLVRDLELQRKREEREAAEQKALKAKQDGICPKCFGEGSEAVGTYGKRECPECVGTGKYYTGSTGDWKLDLRKALYAKGRDFAAWAVAQADASFQSGNLVFRAPKAMTLSLREPEVQHIAAQVLGKPVKVRVEVQESQPPMSNAHSTRQVHRAADEDHEHASDIEEWIFGTAGVPTL